MAFTGCSEFALLASGSSIAISHNTYVKAYNGVDVITIMSTQKSMKKHAYDNVKKVVEGALEGKEYIYEEALGYIKE